MAPGLVRRDRDGPQRPLGSALAPRVGNRCGADMNARVTLYEGATILFPEGPRVVVAVGPFGYTVRDVTGGVDEVSWTDVQPARAIVHGRVDAVAESLMAVLSGLSDDAVQESLDKLEVVLTIRTGFARGHPALARPGEPYSLFNPARKVSDSKKCEAMAKILAREALLICDWFLSSGRVKRGLLWPGADPASSFSPSRANLVCRGLVACGDEDVSGGVSEGVGRGVGVAGDGDGDLLDRAERAHDLLDAHAGLVLEAPGDGQRGEDDGQVGLDRVFGVVEDRSGA
ncbi:hypothetical protein BN11_4100002 [Nostocoides australiense Ben110]|uniref:Uncharacterized protein n=1 Tax=Nostocoides australiense Ben110 TaxID=1193182 RepID=W6JXF5_9MICO|nr:hypothetical protein BN11_4100002 [Tetrasphaera australiensis Ben110]